MRRRKAPNDGLFSPIGGKLEMAMGESPYECAIREVKEETHLEIAEKDLHLFCMATERAYEGKGHWLMFLFDCHKPIDYLPPEMDEGSFSFHSRESIDSLEIPETDKQGLWKIYDTHRSNFVALRVDCEPSKPLNFIIEEIIR